MMFSKILHILAGLLAVQAVAIMKVIREESGIHEAKPIVGRSTPVATTPEVMESLNKRENSTSAAIAKRTVEQNDSSFKFTNETITKFVDLEKLWNRLKLDLLLNN